MRNGLITALALAALTSSARADEAPAIQIPPLTITGKLHPPTPPPPAPGAPPLVRYYPEDAQAQHIEADVMLVCRIISDGGTTDCRVTQESVKGQGFGEKALLVWSLTRMPIGVGSEIWSKGTVYVPMHFRIEKPEPK